MAGTHKVPLILMSSCLCWTWIPRSSLNNTFCISHGGGRWTVFISPNGPALQDPMTHAKRSIQPVSLDALIFGIYGDRDNKCISVVRHEIGFTIGLQLKTPSLKKHNGYCHEKLFMPSLRGSPAHWWDRLLSEEKCSPRIKCAFKTLVSKVTAQLRTVLLPASIKAAGRSPGFPKMGYLPLHDSFIWKHKIIS